MFKEIIESKNIEEKKTHKKYEDYVREYEKKEDEEYLLWYQSIHRSVSA